MKLLNLCCTSTCKANTESTKTSPINRVALWLQSIVLYGSVQTFLLFNALLSIQRGKKENNSPHLFSTET